MNFNDNQKMAVESSGNVILSAGAGSGKTSVIVGHIMHKIESEKNNEKISEFLAGLHVMTFTNLAANELRQRLRKTFSEKAKVDIKWIPIAQNIDQMFIGTIHSFCLKWLKKKQGEIGLVSLEIDNVGLHKKNLENSCQSFREKNKDDPEINQLFVLYGDVIDIAIKQIFSNPILRHRCLKTNYNLQVNFKSEMIKLFNEKKWFNLFELPIASAGLEKNKDQLLELEKLMKGCFDNPDAFIPVTVFLSSTKLRRNAKSVISETLNQIAELKTWITKEWDVVYNYYTIGQTDLKRVHDLIKELARYVDLLLKNTAGITFSDIEYYSLNLLSDPKIQKEISGQISYLIVDEFQDTSEVQFSIIRKSIIDEFSKLFIVGDPKQAIYRFRGGDVNIFNYCLKNMKQSLKLDTNYRSSKSIVDFSNAFFEQVLGENFDYPQIAFQAAENKVVISESTDEGKFEVELPQVMHYIADYWQKEDIKDIAIILRTLKGAQVLFKELLLRNYSFKVRFSKNFSEHPLVELFKAFLFVLVAEKDKALGPQTYLAKILELWGAQQNDFDGSKYKNLIGYYPVDYLFYTFLKDFGLYWFLSQDQLKSLSELSRGCVNISEIISTINNSEYRAKIDLNFGNSGKEILIMSAHSTKGLEFDAVIVADTSSSVNNQVSRDKVFGKDWDSFSWKDKTRNKKYKSLPYLLDHEVEKVESTSEYRRLLYVAITRAKKYLTIVLSKGGNSKSVWGKLVIEAAQKINYPLTSFENTTQSDESVERKTSSPNWLYLFNGSQIIQPASDRYVISDLSVSRLSTLALCQRKHYFENILKLDTKLLLMPPDYNKETVEDSDKIYSSAQRGTNLHNQLSKFLTKKISSFSDSKIPIEDREKLEWCMSFLNNLADYSVSETEIKFPWNKIVINGTPDLFGKNGKRQWVIDFKTGDIVAAKLIQYKAQLLLYSYGLSQLKYFDSNLPIENYLIFLDRKEVKEFVYESKDIENQIDLLMLKMKDVSIQNLEHCSQCQFQKICY